MWHGWRVGKHGKNVHVGALPGRKKLALYVQEDDGPETVIRVLAYFQGEEEAQEMVEWVDEIVGRIKAGSDF